MHCWNKISSDDSIAKRKQPPELAVQFTKLQQSNVVAQKHEIAPPSLPIQSMNVDLVILSELNDKIAPPLVRRAFSILKTHETIRTSPK